MNRIAIVRKAKGVSQKWLADKIGVNVVYLSQIEHGRKTGSVDTLFRIARALGVQADDLYIPDEEEQKDDSERTGLNP